MFISLLFIQLILHFLFLPNAPEEKPVTSQIPTGIVSGPEIARDSLYSVLVNKLTIQGTARYPSIIGLEHNGRFVASTISSQGRYSFPDYHLAPGENNFLVWGLGSGGETVLIDSFSIRNSSARTKALSRSFEQLPTDKKILALTFDGGSESNGADSIIQILSGKGIDATFFLTGYFIRRFPDLVLRLDQPEFEIANHSFSHPHLTTWTASHEHQNSEHVNADYISLQLLRTDSLYQQLTGKNLAPYWRAPFGEYNQEILNWAAQAGYRHIGWSQKCDSWDWVSDEESDLYRSSHELLDHFLELERSGGLFGAVILMHLNSNRIADHPYKILSQLIDSLQIKDYKFVKISRLISEIQSM